jgi:fucose 4-O-acetylase-like acetyltransferase
METVMTKRSDQLDMVKALGIIAVVYGHAVGPFANFVSLYHLALFFFVSGYLYKDSYTVDPVALVKKRIKSLYVPFIAFGLLFGLLHNCLFKLNIYTDKVESAYNRASYFYTNQEYFLNLLKIASFAKVEQILAPLWFLPVLFIVNILFTAISYFIYKINPRRRDLWLAVAIAGMFCLGFLYYPEKNLILRPVSIAMVVAVIFYIGYLFKRYESAFDFNFGYALSCFMVLAVSSLYGTIDNGGHQFVSPPFYLACSLCGIYLNCYIARVVADGSLLKRFLVFTGRNTITVLALHFLAFRAVNYLQVKIYDLPPYMTGQHPRIPSSDGWWALYFAAGILLPLASRVVYDRFKQVLFKRRAYPTAA